MLALLLTVEATPNLLQRDAALSDEYCTGIVYVNASSECHILL